MSALQSLLNIGPSVARHLQEVGIETAEELKEVGYLDAFMRIRFLNPKVMGNKMALYALYGALTEQNCVKLDKETKAMLDKELEAALAHTQN